MLISVHSNAGWMVVMTINYVVVSKWVSSVNNGWCSGHHTAGPGEVILTSSLKGQGKLGCTSGRR